MIIFLFITCLCAAVFTAIGVCASRRKDPIWFWSGSTVKPEEISDIPAYNRANGRMWIGYSLLYWLSALLVLLGLPQAAGIMLGIGAVGGTLALVFVYQRIYKKYARKP